MTTRLYASALRMRDLESCMRLAFADCLRCGEPAFPTRGYCSRQCEECEAYDEAHGLVPEGQHQITNSAPMTDAEFAEWCEAYDKRDEGTWTLTNAESGAFNLTYEAMVAEIERMLAQSPSPPQYAWHGLEAWLARPEDTFFEPMDGEYRWAELRCEKPAYTCKIVSLTDPEDE